MVAALTPFGRGIRGGSFREINNRYDLWVQWKATLMMDVLVWLSWIQLAQGTQSTRGGGQDTRLRVIYGIKERPNQTLLIEGLSG
jgi:hypothetical protein